jgi:hypothetical protein
MTDSDGMPPVTTPPLSPDARGSFAQTRQPGSDTSIRPPATLRQVDGRAQAAPTIVMVDQAALGRIQATPPASMRNRNPR